MGSLKARPKSDARAARVTQDALVAARGRNLRQLLLRSMRLVSASIEDELERRGYDDIRLAHNALVANLDLDGNSITEVAERAQMTKQSMGLLAEELEALGYLTRDIDANDARVRVLRFTARGRRLLLDSLEIIAEIERASTERLGEASMEALRLGLRAFVGDSEVAPKP